MVLGPGNNRAPVRFRLSLNGDAPGGDHGSATNADGTGEVRQPRMYQLVRQKGPIKDVTFEIEFLDPGIEIFSFTFGWQLSLLFCCQADRLIADNHDDSKESEKCKTTHS
jgi:hypothetical protein